jgi:hypothetical protein
VNRKSQAPTSPPIGLGTTRENSFGSRARNSRRDPHVLPNGARQILTVLGALAVTEFNPNRIKVGKVTRVPPPATELMSPARKATKVAPVGIQSSRGKIPACALSVKPCARDDPR